MTDDIDPERKFSNGSDWNNSIDWDDASDGSDGGYNIHGSPINAEAMKELIQLRMTNAWLIAAQSNLDEFSKHKNWELAYKKPTYYDDPDQEQCWVVWENTGSINDREWEAIGKGDSAAEAIAAAIREKSNNE